MAGLLLMSPGAPRAAAQGGSYKLANVFLKYLEDADQGKSLIDAKLAN